MAHQVNLIDDEVDADVSPSPAQTTRLPRSGAGTAFWPVDPPSCLADSVPAAYRTIPTGLRIIGLLQAFAATVILVSYWQMNRLLPIWPNQAFDVLLTVASLIVGIKLASARGWAWWVSCTVLYFGTITSIGGVVKAECARSCGVRTLRACGLLFSIAVPQSPKHHGRRSFPRRYAVILWAARLGGICRLRIGPSSLGAATISAILIEHVFDARCDKSRHLGATNVR
jgi:hypothetical protein